MDINILQALDRIPPEIEREQWYRILAALKAEYGDSGREIAENWSKGADSYKPTDLIDVEQPERQRRNKYRHAVSYS